MNVLAATNPNVEGVDKVEKSQTHLTFFPVIDTSTPISEQMDILTEKLWEFSSRAEVKERVKLVIDFDGHEKWEERIQEVREIEELKFRLYKKFLDDFEKLYSKEDGKILIQVPLSHAGFFIPYLIERKNQEWTKLSRLNIEYVIIDTESIERLAENGEHLDTLYKAYVEKIKGADTFVQIVDTGNDLDTFTWDSDKKKKIKWVNDDYKKTLAWLLKERENKLRLYFPSETQAEKEGMTLKEFYQLYTQAVSLDWQRIEAANQELVELFKKYDSVGIKWEHADISFDIHGMGARNSVVKTNYPGSEVHGAPNREWVDGWIEFNNPIYIPFLWKDISGIKLQFEKGKLIDFELLWDYVEGEKADITHLLTQRLDAKEGNRYVWELAFGTNFFVPVGIKHTLIGEKALGMHMALWRSYGYTGVDNGNNGDWWKEVDIHWDIIRNMRDGTIVTFSKKDGTSIEVMKNGNFIKSSLPLLTEYQKEITLPNSLL